MVATDSPFASRVGRDVLRAGGNAIDASTAASFALAVTRPYSTGLGGGGFLIYRPVDSGDYQVFDYRECAPAASTPDMFVQQADHGGPPPSRFGGLAVAVPGWLAGRAEIHRRFGTIPLSELIRPAIELARDGFPVDEHYINECRDVAEIYGRYPELRDTCGYVWRVHLRDGNLRRPGDRLQQPALARLLQEIADGGVDAFYRGRVRDDVIRSVIQSGGILTAQDLDEYEVIERQPIRSQYRGLELVLMPPPSSGGICIAETLNILESVPLERFVRRDESSVDHFLIEAMKYAFADRAKYLGDADYVSVPVSKLISKTYASQFTLSAHASNVPAPTKSNEPPIISDDSGTSHSCVVDRWGNIVVATETINTSFGSLLAVDEWGLILNNEMDDFTADPHAPNAYGLTQGAANAISAGKRPLSSMSPTIVIKDGMPYLAIGASGGPRIISSVLNVLINLTDRGMSLPQAVDAVRVHHQWQPDSVFFDRAPSNELAADLVTHGHHISPNRRTGIVQAILIDGPQLIGVSDPRKGGTPAGY